MVKRYITTTLPYVNAAPHIGFALEMVQTDALTRLWRSWGNEVFLNTGTDEHGIKIYRKALEEGKDPQVYVDSAALNFKRLMEALNISEHAFIRTTDSHHMAAAQEFWRRCAAAGDIEKKVYRTKYCAGCELEKTDSELADGKCPLHPTLAIEEREEENYFFKFSRYQKKLLDLYDRFPDFVMPAHRLTEIRNFVSGGLVDFSISRLKEKMPWGVLVPDDPGHVMYVWFDALVNYISTLGWPASAEATAGKPEDSYFNSYWGTKGKPNAVQVAGKDNLRQQSAMWQAMLISAGLPPSRQIFIHGFITSGGQKMSKTAGNVVDPFALVTKYGADALRYYLLREIPASEDGDFSEEKFRERYNADLANGIGNFAARVTTLAAGMGEFSGELKPDVTITERIEKTKETMNARLAEYRFHEALASLWELISFGDSRVNDTKPWAMPDGAEKQRVLLDLVVLLDNIAALAAPFLPEAAGKITSCITWEGKALRVKKVEPLFPRLT